MQSIDLSAYIKAGYVPQCGCRSDTALDWAYHHLFPQAVGLRERDWRVRWNEDGDRVEMNIGDEEIQMWVGSVYYYENETLFKKEEV